MRRTAFILCLLVAANHVSADDDPLAFLEIDIEQRCLNQWQHLDRTSDKVRQAPQYLGCVSVARAERERALNFWKEAPITVQSECRARVQDREVSFRTYRQLWNCINQTWTSAEGRCLPHQLGC